MAKVNFQENTLFYLNQSYLTIKKNKQIYYCDYFIIEQIVESLNLPQDVSSYTLKGNKVKIVRPYYDPETEEFKGLSETIWLFSCKRFAWESLFLTTGSMRKNQKFCTLITEREFQIPFLGLFSADNWPWLRTEKETVIFQEFISSSLSTGWKKKINIWTMFHFLGQEQLNVWAGSAFHLSKLDLFGLEKTLCLMLLLNV